MNEPVMNPEPSPPSFMRPPLQEVAAGVQFAPLGVRSVDVAALHTLLAEEYPNWVDAPPLPPSFETFGTAPVGPFPVPPMLLSGTPPWLPRAWFISADDEHIVQAQPDRLIVNWRRQPQGGHYPRYAEVRRRFVAAHDAVERLVEQRGLSRPLANQCDLSYFNVVRVPEAADWSDMDRLLRGMRLDPGPGWQASLSDAQVSIRKVLRRESGVPFARLSVDCLPVLDFARNKSWALNIVVRGQPQSGNFGSVLAFLDAAHLEIASCFAAITTEAMHMEWEKQT